MTGQQLYESQPGELGKPLWRELRPEEQEYWDKRAEEER